jgi:ribosomal protein S18 acetylase RimI-like enzyme
MRRTAEGSEGRIKEPVEIHPLHPYTQEEIWLVVSGYETDEIYTVEKTETDERTVFDIRLARLEQPFRDSFHQDFSPEECRWHNSLLEKGFCFGAYQGSRLAGFVIGEPLLEDRLARVWEIHVLEEFRGMGVGRALLERVMSRAREAHLESVMLETQNTNVKAVRFYRRMGFTLDSIDCSPPYYRNEQGEGTGQVAFYMKHKLAADE